MVYAKLTTVYWVVNTECLCISALSDVRLWQLMLKWVMNTQDVHGDTENKWCVYCLCLNPHILPCDALCKCSLCCWPVSFYLSIVFLYCIKTTEDIVKLLSRSSSPIILIFWPWASVHNSKGNPLNGGAKYMGWGKRDFWLKSPFSLEMVQDRCMVAMEC